MNRPLLFAFLLIGLSLGRALAQTPPPASPVKVTLADGRVLPANSLRRSKDTLLVTVSVATGVRGETGYPIATVRKIQIPEPLPLKAARTLLAQGNAAGALAQIHPVVLAQGDLRQIPGNYWAPAALIEVDALLALKRDRDAGSLINELTSNLKDSELIQDAQMALARLWLRTGRSAEAVPVFDRTIASSKNAITLSRAWIGRGDALYAGGDYDGALLAYLRIPIFYSNETTYLPAALLGSARAYEGLGDFDQAKAALVVLSRDFAAAPETAQSKKDLARIERKLSRPAN